MKQLMAFAITFRRYKPREGDKKSDGWEQGLYIGRHEADEVGFIVDMDGKVVSETCSYHDRFYNGTLVLRDE